MAERGNPVSLPITPRSILVGAAGMALLALLNPYMAYVKHTWEVGYGSLLSGVVLLLFALVAVNGAMARWTRASSSLGANCWSSTGC